MRPRALSQPGNSADAQILSLLEMALGGMKAAKPNDRSERDRHYAVARTDLEKVIAYWERWIVYGVPAEPEAETDE